MPSSFSTSIYHHGKRHTFSVTPKDESRQAYKVALADLEEQVRFFTEAIAPEVKRQSYRKPKGG